MSEKIRQTHRPSRAGWSSTQYFRQSLQWHNRWPILQWVGSEHTQARSKVKFSTVFGIIGVGVLASSAWNHVPSKYLSGCFIGCVWMTRQANKMTFLLFRDVESDGGLPKQGRNPMHSLAIGLSQGIGNVSDNVLRLVYSHLHLCYHRWSMFINHLVKCSQYVSHSKYHPSKCKAACILHMFRSLTSCSLFSYASVDSANTKLAIPIA